MLKESLQQLNVMTRYRFSQLAVLAACALLSLAIAFYFKTPASEKLRIQIIEETITVTDRPNSHFHVLFTNRSNQRVRLWDEWIMWGHENLSFELQDSTNKSLGQLKRQYSWFGRNFPHYYELQPHEHFIMDVYFDPKEWSVPVEPGADYDCFLVAKYSVDRSPESDQHEVWVGAIESAPKKILLRYWSDSTRPEQEQTLPAPAEDSSAKN